jgi:hypothetical protein
VGADVCYSTVLRRTMRRDRGAEQGRGRGRLLFDRAPPGQCGEIEALSKAVGADVCYSTVLRRDNAERTR